MSLIEEFKQDFVLLEKRRTPDGEGGWVVSWVDGIPFRASLYHANTIEARVAEKEGMGSTYTLTTERNMKLDYHDVVRRESDKATFRVTSASEDIQTPDIASFQFARANAERWDLT